MVKEDRFTALSEDVVTDLGAELVDVIATELVNQVDVLCEAGQGVFDLLRIACLALLLCIQMEGRVEPISSLSIRSRETTQLSSRPR